MEHKPIRVFCVDDNELVTQAIEVKLSREPGFQYLGSLPDASGLLAEVLRLKPDVVLLDIDMPGRDPFEALKEVADQAPDTRVIMLTAHVRKDLLDRAFEAGAWGYLSKGQGVDDLMAGIRRIASGEFTVGPDEPATWQRS